MAVRYGATEMTAVNVIIISLPLPPPPWISESLLVLLH